MKWEEIVQEARIFIIDDEESNVRVMGRMFDQAGYKKVLSTTDPRKAAELYREFRPDLVLLDLRMPDMDGFEVMQRLRDETSPREYLPVLVITADLAPEAKLQALLLGAKDFLTKPVDRIETMLRVRILLETRFLFRELQEERTRLEGISKVGT